MPMDEGKKLRSHETWSLNGMPLTETRLDSASTTKNPISNLFPSKKRRCSWSIASLFFSLCVSSLIVKMFCCISLSPPLQWLWEVCLYGHFKATFAASSVVHFFLFLKLLQHAISHIFRPKVRSKQFFKKTCVSRTPRKKGTANTLLDKDFNFWSIFWRND